MLRPVGLWPSFCFLVAWHSPSRRTTVQPSRSRNFGRARSRGVVLSEAVCATVIPGRRTCTKKSMAHAMSTAAESRVLQSHPRMTFQAGSYSYRSSATAQSIYRVTDGRKQSANRYHTFPLTPTSRKPCFATMASLRGRVGYYSGIDAWTEVGDKLESPPVAGSVQP
jgi:hypothetical protein